MSQDKLQLAAKVVQDAKELMQDTLPHQLAEAWLNAKLNGEQTVQSFYTIEELAQTPISSSVRNIVGQACTEMLLGRFEESRDTLQQAFQRSPDSLDAIVGAIICSNLTGRDASEYEEALDMAREEHPFLRLREEASERFDLAAQKYVI